MLYRVTFIQLKPTVYMLFINSLCWYSYISRSKSKLLREMHNWSGYIRSGPTSSGLGLRNRMAKVSLPNSNSYRIITHINNYYMFIDLYS